ncbi:hypothetical protein PsorP6_009401 [Peronosclerospora sorghi]|uniref:Uncharacterized protein n=1 Tax=Peronosclerospora sorghi TaxID=230839 RepID=A0ACC0VXB9_9STRA|nr:hypothetical protein PsorP6_009401 [Peronosclerospora sorghi]
MDYLYDEKWTARQDADETDGAVQEEPAQLGAHRASDSGEQKSSWVCSQWEHNQELLNWT